MSRRTDRPQNDKSITKNAAGEVSQYRRAQINDAANKAMDQQDLQARASIVFSSSFKKDSLNKLGSIVSPMNAPTTSTSTERMAPEIYSPLFQLSNLNLPRDRITMNAWNRIYYDTNPLVRNAINLHASFPISKININCKNKIFS